MIMKYIIGKHTILGLLAVMLVLLTGCQAEGADTTPRQNPTMEMQALATNYVDANQPASTRAGEWWPTELFELYTGKDPIKLAFTKGNSIAKQWDKTKGEDGEEIDKYAEGIFQFKEGEGKWGSTFLLPKNDTYYLYGYMPAVGNMTLTSVNSDFSNGAVLEITGLPTATTNDICVIVGVKKGVVIGTNPGKEESDPDYNIYGLDGDDPIQMGQFGYEIAGGQNHVYLLCDHLYAGIRLRFNVNHTYNTLRTIKLKKVWVMDFMAGETEVKSKSKAVVTLEANNTGSNPLSVTYENDGSSGMQNIMLWTLSGEDDGTLPDENSDEFLEINGYILPELKSAGGTSLNLTAFTLVSQYDVYDTNGNLIRKDQTAENKIKFSTLFQGVTQIERKKRYTIKLTVNPTYLYMMSEPDLDNPTIEIVGGGI